MRSSDQGWDAIDHALRAVKTIANGLTVPLIANLKSGGAKIGDYENSSVTTEYYFENEASQILLGLQETGFFTRLYAGEIDFINAVLDGSFDELPRPRKRPTVRLLPRSPRLSGSGPVCTENLIRVDEATESTKLAQ